VAFVFGLAAAIGWHGTDVLSFFAVAAFVAAAVYLSDVRPRVKEFRSGGTRTHQGPYGPW
jgi:uncharacterized membrane protein